MTTPLRMTLFEAYFKDMKTDNWDSFDAQLIYFSGAP
jgi:hypothetical protein